VGEGLGHLYYSAFNVSGEKEMVGIGGVAPSK
jgi:hypothetical protein